MLWMPYCWRYSRQVGWGFKQPNPVERDPDHVRQQGNRWTSKVPSSLNHYMIPWSSPKPSDKWELHQIKGIQNPSTKKKKKDSLKRPWNNLEIFYNQINVANESMDKPSRQNTSFLQTALLMNLHSDPAALFQHFLFSVAKNFHLAKDSVVMPTSIFNLLHGAVCIHFKDM